MLRRAPFIAALAALVAVLASLAAAPPSDAARPAKGKFYNASYSTGLYAVTTPHTISTLQLFCGGNSRYDVADALSINRAGAFAYRGIAYGYGESGRPTGTFKISLSGRFTSPTHVQIKRTIEGCGAATARAAAL